MFDREQYHVHYFKEFNEQTFNGYYNEYEKFLYSNSPLRYCIVASLENFGYSQPNSDIILSTNVRILSASSVFYPLVTEDSKYQDMWRDEGLWFSEQSHYWPPEFFIEIDYEMERKQVPSKRKEKEHIESDAKKKVADVLKILRLYKKGDLTCGWWAHFPKSPCDPPYNKDVLLDFRGNYSSTNKYSLKEEEVKDLCLLFQRYQTTYGKKDFPHNAIEGFNAGLEESDAAKKLVDFVSALESLFDVREGEIKHKLAGRVFRFLEKDSQLRRKISEDIEKAYDLRSCIVHGRLNKIDPLDCEEYARKTEKYLRKSISSWLDKLEKGCTAKDIRDQIESERF